MTQPFELSKTDKIALGVCGGLAEAGGTDYVKADARAYRLLFVFLAALFGIGVILYLYCWVLAEGNRQRRELTRAIVDERIAELRAESKAAKEIPVAEPIVAEAVVGKTPRWRGELR